MALEALDNLEALNGSGEQRGYMTDGSCEAIRCADENKAGFSLAGNLERVLGFG